MLGMLGSLGSSLLSGLGSLGSSVMSGLGSAGGTLKNFLGSAGGSGFGEVAKGLGGLLSAGASMYGAIDQSKRAKKEMAFQRQMYNDWNNTRLGNQANLGNAYNDVFGANNDFYKKQKGGLLGSNLYN